MMRSFGNSRTKCISLLDLISIEVLHQFYCEPVEPKVCAVAVAEGVQLARPFLWTID